LMNGGGAKRVVGRLEEEARARFKERRRGS
jgi:hypothetical protein